MECLKRRNEVTEMTQCRKHLTITSVRKSRWETSSEGSIISNYLRRNKILKTLSLKDLFIPQNVIDNILQGISDNNVVQELHMSSINMSDSFAALAFLKMLEKNESLQVLNLKGNNEIGDETAKCIAQALVKNSSLTSLDLSQTSVTTTGVLSLSEMISKHGTKTTLNIGGARSFLKHVSRDARGMYAN